MLLFSIQSLNCVLWHKHKYVAATTKHAHGNFFQFIRIKNKNNNQYLIKKKKKQ